MTVRAGLHATRRGHNVPAGQRPSGRAVVELPVGPVDRVVAGGAQGSGELRSHMIGNRAAQSRCAVPVRGMASGVVAIRNREFVIVVDVALGAGSGHVSAGQREACGCVVESADIVPGNRVMAPRAVRNRKGGSQSRVDRVIGSLPGGEMAAGVAAIRGSNLKVVVAVDVATGARHAGMAVGQRESSNGVIEGHVRPRRGVVALRAVRDGECRPDLRVRGIVGLLPGRQVATGVATIGRGNLQIVIVVDVATGARHVGVAGRQWESRGAVIELGAEPTVEIVTALAIGGRKRRARAGVGRARGALPILQVAGIALRGEAIENAGGELLVALIALHGGVRAKQRKTALMILHLLDGNVPSLNRVALRAIGSHLTAVNV